MSLFEFKEKKADSEFAFGVQLFKKIEGGYMLSGRVDGTVRQGAEVYIVNPGVDTAIATAKIEEVHMQSGTVSTTSDCSCGLGIGEVEDIEIRTGSVLYTKNINPDKIQSAYISAIGDMYVSNKGLNLSDDELDKMSIIDLAESWRLFGWFVTKATMQHSEQQRKEISSKIEKVGSTIAKKILEVDDIYVVYNRITKEPHLFSNVAKREDGKLMCSAPDVLLVPTAYYSAMSKYYNVGDFELKKIKNGEDKKGIYNFLGDTFYRNGAVGVAVISSKTSIAAQMLVAPPDYGDIPIINIPVTNPDLVRWMLLYFQLGKLDTPDKQMIGNLFYSLMAKELVKANLLIPMKKEGEIPAPDENGRVILPKDLKMEFACIKGKSNRDAVKMFTDWPRLRAEYGEEWEGMTQPVSGMIGMMDVVININSEAELGCYIDQKIFDEINNQQK